jgi:hypothetical protein
MSMNLTWPKLFKQSRRKWFLWGHTTIWSRRTTYAFTSFSSLLRLFLVRKAANRYFYYQLALVEAHAHIYIYGIDEKTKKRYTERKNKKNLFITFFVMSTFMTWSFFITSRQTIRQDGYEMKPASIFWSFIL